MASEGVEDVGGAGEVEHELGRAGVRDALYLHASVGADGDGQSLVDSRRPIGPSVPVRALGWRSPRWMEVRSGAHLAVDERGDGEVPRGVGGHAEPQEGPDPVVVEGGDEHRGGAAGAEDVRPCPLVQPVVDVVDVAAHKKDQPNISQASAHPALLTSIVQQRNGTHLAQAISWMTEPKSRNVQLKARPAAFQYGPSSPSSTSNHWSRSSHHKIIVSSLTTADTSTTKFLLPCLFVFLIPDC